MPPPAGKNDVDLVDALVAKVHPEFDTAQSQSLSEQLAAVWRGGREVWPGVDVSWVEFAEKILENFPPGSVAELSTARSGDLYLAAACVAGNDRALECFERHCMADLNPSIIRLTPNGVDDVKQLVREELLCPPDLRIARYGGRADLRAWVRVVAVRRAIKERAKHSREGPTPDSLLLDLAEPVDRERSMVKERFRSELTTAFRRAFAELTPKERNLLRAQLLDELSIDDIGNMHRVHRSTAARWLERIRNRLHEGIDSYFAEELSLPASELDSVIQLVISRFETSLRELLRSGSIHHPPADES